MNDTRYKKGNLSTSVLVLWKIRLRKITNESCTYIWESCEQKREHIPLIYGMYCRDTHRRKNTAFLGMIENLTLTKDLEIEE